MSAASINATARPLHGRVALVTGSTSGIGWAIASALAEAGADVMLNGFWPDDSGPSRCAGLAERCGVRVAHAAADVAHGAEVARMVGDTEARFGRLDILVNNAGIQHVAAIDELPDERWDAILAINLSSNFHAIKAALPGMKARGSGRIVNIASAHGLVASPFKGAYVAAKHGVVGLTKAVALEVAETAITCNAICPGFVRTALVDAQIAALAQAHGASEDAVVRDVILASQPTRRFVTVEQIAALVLFLCSDAAASITGAALPVDGAWTAR
ncbi:MAG: 3-hydroxybutyrate dehydrogenase [Caldimonas sp.]